jgi:hypothetical protein
MISAACRLRGLILIAGALSSAVVMAEDPRVAYWLHCAGCHLLDGTSAPPEVPTLIDEPGRIAGLPGGREYLMRIPGVAQAGLGDEKLAEVLNFMLEQFSPTTTPGDFEPFNGEEVRRARQRVLIDPLRSRTEIVGD